MFFRRREKESEDQELENELPIKKKPVFRQPYRELPPKPWGRKERMVVLLVFLITALASGVLALYASGFKLPKFPKISLPSFSLEQTYTITKEP